MQPRLLTLLHALCAVLCHPQLQQLFPDKQDWASIQTLMAAAQLLRSSSSSSSSSGAMHEGGAESAAWAELYAHEHAASMLMILACWMPEPLAAGFLRTHWVSGEQKEMCWVAGQRCSGSASLKRVDEACMG